MKRRRLQPEVANNGSSPEFERIEDPMNDTLTEEYSRNDTVEATPSSDDPFYLQSLAEIDALASNANATVTRVGNVNIFNNATAVCRMDYMVGLSNMVNRPSPPNGTAPPVRVLTPGNFGVTGAAAVALAVQHLNTGDGSVVQAVEGLDKRCNIKFQFQALDSYWSQKLAVDQIIDNTAGTDGDAQGEENGIKNNQILPCVMLGDIASRITLSTSMITSLKGYPQMSYSTATELDNRVLYPLATRITPSLSGHTGIMIRYI